MINLALTRPAILRQIAADQVEPIQEVVKVEYDNALQTPLSFRYRDAQIEVLELLGAYRERRDSPSVVYLVRAGNQVYALCAEMSKSSPDKARGRWVLRFRVRESQEEPVLVDFQLKRIADFHGHLCPDLVIGYRACQCALSRLKLELLAAPGLRVVAENTTSAIDAIQHATGCTTGNGRLMVQDNGKHVYTFIAGDGEGVRLSLKPNWALFDPEYLALEVRLQAEQATLWEVAHYQALLDERIVTLLHLDEETLFDVQPTSSTWPEDQITSALVPCSRCNELTAPTHLVVIEGRRVCLTCAKTFA
jgi:formylmethanofuran dehydrogenase subunit E